MRWLGVVWQNETSRIGGSVEVPIHQWPVVQGRVALASRPCGAIDRVSSRPSLKLTKKTAGVAFADFDCFQKGDLFCAWVHTRSCQSPNCKDATAPTIHITRLVKTSRMGLRLLSA